MLGNHLDERRDKGWVAERGPLVILCHRGEPSSPGVSPASLSPEPGEAALWWVVSWLGLDLWAPKKLHNTVGAL